MSISQDAVGRFVSDHVFSNVTMLVVDYANCDDEAREMFESTPDYKEAATDYIEDATRKELEQIVVSYRGLDYQSIVSDSSLQDIREQVLVYAENNGYDEFCIDYGIEACTDDIYEYWAVSEFLANHLEQHGEKIVPYGSTYIWGRSCCGQAIKLDSVINDIAGTLPRYC